MSLNCDNDFDNKGNVITMLIKSFDLSNSCIQIRAPCAMMRTSELGNTG